MKKAIPFAGLLLILTACNSNDNGSGAVESTKGDTTVYLPDTTKTPKSPETDTARGEDRVDMQGRDTLRH
jgi:hypothetical protein